MAIGSASNSAGQLSMEATARTYRYLDATELDQIRAANAAKAKAGAKK